MAKRRRSAPRRRRKTTRRRAVRRYAPRRIVRARRSAPRRRSSGSGNAITSSLGHGTTRPRTMDKSHYRTPFKAAVNRPKAIASSHYDYQANSWQPLIGPAGNLLYKGGKKVLETLEQIGVPSKFTRGVNDAMDAAIGPGKAALITAIGSYYGGTTGASLAPLGVAADNYLTNVLNGSKNKVSQNAMKAGAAAGSLFKNYDKYAKLGWSGLDKLDNEVKRLGNTYHAQTARFSNNFNSSFTNLNKQMSGQGNSRPREFGETILDYFSGGIDNVKNHFKDYDPIGEYRRRKEDTVNWWTKLRGSNTVKRRSPSWSAPNSDPQWLMSLEERLALQGRDARGNKIKFSEYVSPVAPDVDSPGHIYEDDVEFNMRLVDHGDGAAYEPWPDIDDPDFSPYAGQNTPVRPRLEHFRYDPRANRSLLRRNQGRNMREFNAWARNL